MKVQFLLSSFGHPVDSLRFKHAKPPRDFCQALSEAQITKLQSDLRTVEKLWRDLVERRKAFFKKNN